MRRPKGPERSAEIARLRATASLGIYKAANKTAGFGAQIAFRIAAGCMLLAGAAGTFAVLLAVMTYNLPPPPGGFLPNPEIGPAIRLTELASILAALAFVLMWWLSGREP